MKNKWKINSTSKSMRTGEFRIRSVFTLFGLTFSADGLFIWTSKWFGFIKIREEKVLIHYSEFDSGWTYQNYWGKLNTIWRFVEKVP